MNKLLIALAAVAGLSQGCVHRETYWERLQEQMKRYTHEFYVPGAVEASNKPTTNIPNARMYTGSLVAISDDFPLKTTFYAATQVNLPKKTVAFCLDDQHANVLTEETARINMSGLDQIIQDETWVQVKNPDEVIGKGTHIVLGIQKGHIVESCPTKEHVVNEYDTFAITEVYIITPQGKRNLELVGPRFGAYDYDPVNGGYQRRMQVGPLRDKWQEHYETKHVKKK